MTTCSELSSIFFLNTNLCNQDMRDIKEGSFFLGYIYLFHNMLEYLVKCMINILFSDSDYLEYSVETEISTFLTELCIITAHACNKSLYIFHCGPLTYQSPFTCTRLWMATNFKIQKDVHIIQGLKISMTHKNVPIYCSFVCLYEIR